MVATPRALALIGDETGCSLWRVWQPFAELERHGVIAEWCHKDQSESVLTLLAAGRYDVIVTPRIVWPAEGLGERWVNAIHNAGIAWIYEVDDDVYSPIIVERQMRLFESERLKGAYQLEWERNERIRLLTMCDGITVSTKRLATIVKNYAPEGTPVKVVPNAIDARWFRETLHGCDRVPQLMGKLTIGWAGGTREDADLKPLIEAWPVIAERYPDVMFVIQGHISEALADSVPIERRATLPWLPIPEYPRAMLNVDIACCVVAPLMFNTSKSCIKWYEFTLAGAVCVVSPTTYGREVTDGVDGLVAESTEEWVEALSRLIESAELRRTLRREARRKVMTEYSLENNWQNWPLAWADAVEHFKDKESRRLVLATG